ncbi:MAG: polysaccharide biosynthesis tyrosine autokinase [Scytonematopsis contorta HA4267-MV1]|nr:polysaccharide biosynthesis tyrosine autokinase [Scytonematopsis contorta HA4267-MV1]
MPTKETGLQQPKNSTTLAREPYWLFRKPESDETEGGLSLVFAVLRRRLAVIASVAVLVTSGAAFWTSTRTAKYEGRFQMLVEPLKRSDSELLKLLSESLKQNVNDITRETKTELDYQALMEVLKSPKLINPVITDVRTQYGDINYDRLVGNDVGGKVPSGREGTLYITRIAQGKDESRVVEVRYRDSDPKKVVFILDKLSEAYRRYSVEQQQSNLRQGIRFVDQQIPKLQLRVSTLQGQLQGFQQRFGVFNPELQGEQLLKRSEQLRLERLESEKKLAEARSLFASLQSQLGMQQDTAIAASALSESPQYQQLLTEIRKIDAEIAKESTRFNEGSPKIQGLREQRQKLMPILNEEARNALGNNAPPQANPQATTYVNTVRRELTQQLAQASSQIKQLEASLNANTKATVQANQQVQQYPLISRQYANLVRELQVATDTLNQLSSRQEALRVDAAQQEIPWDIIMPPNIARNKNGQLVPISPDNSRDIALGGAAGLLLGILAAFLVENLHNVYHDPEQVKSATKLPLLGVIPYQKNIKKQSQTRAAKELVLVGSGESDKEYRPLPNRQLREYDYSGGAEGFCSLYTRVKAIRSENRVRTLAVTSATKGEGKSSVAVNLAQTAAFSGQRVLLVDANLPQPQVHRHLGLVNTKGLSDVLAQGADLDDVIGQAPGEENLFVITAGEKISSNPAKLFSSVRMETFLERAMGRFDLIIFDAPQLLGRLDSNILANYVDSVLLVVALGKTPRNVLKEVMEETKASNISVLGMVANNVRP